MFRKYAFVWVAFVAAFVGLAGNAGAEQAAAMAGSVVGHNEFTVKAALALAAGFGIAIAAFGGAFGQSRAATAALEGIARNPGAANKVQTPMIIGLALIESLVIYALIISFILQGKV